MVHLGFFQIFRQRKKYTKRLIQVKTPIGKKKYSGKQYNKTIIYWVTNIFRKYRAVNFLWYFVVHTPVCLGNINI